IVARLDQAEVAQILTHRTQARHRGGDRRDRGVFPQAAFRSLRDSTGWHALGSPACNLDYVGERSFTLRRERRAEVMSSLAQYLAAALGLFEHERHRLARAFESCGKLARKRDFCEIRAEVAEQRQGAIKRGDLRRRGRLGIEARAPLTRTIE